MGILRFLMGTRKGVATRAAADWVALLSAPSGYDRKEAVDALHHLQYAAALPDLLVRINDWVPQVRSAAHAAILSFLQPPYLPDWLRGLDAIVALTRSHRADHGELLGLIQNFLCHPENMPAVLTAASTASINVKRYVFKLRWVAAKDEAARFQLLQSALTGTDFLLARQALRDLNSIASAAMRLSLVDTACSSRFASVRCSGLRLALASPQPSTASLIQRMALDGSMAVRALALPALRSQGNAAEVVSKALSVLGQPHQPAKSRGVALQFLWSLQKDETRGLCQEMLSSTAPYLRRVAMNALMSTATGDELERLLLLALADTSPKVQRLAVDRVLRGACVPHESTVMSLALRHGTTQALIGALSILSRSSNWNFLHWLLYAMQQVTNDDTRQRLLVELGQWANDAGRCYETPSEAQRGIVLASWRGNSERLPKQLRESISSHLQTYQIL